MTEPIENLYFNWLCAKVLQPHNPNYYSLMEILHRTEFAWVVPEDAHRAEDGIQLRLDFLRETGYNLDDPLWLEQPCSVLECLIALAKRIGFLFNVPTHVWFWDFLKHLGLDEYRRVSEEDISVIEEVLFNFIWRQYKPNGFGGIFPLEDPKRDQRNVELWYQYADYVKDRHLI